MVVGMRSEERTRLGERATYKAQSRVKEREGDLFVRAGDSEDGVEAGEPSIVRPSTRLQGSSKATASKSLLACSVWPAAKTGEPGMRPLR